MEMTPEIKKEDKEGTDRLHIPSRDFEFYL